MRRSRSAASARVGERPGAARASGGSRPRRGRRGCGLDIGAASLGGQRGCTHEGPRAMGLANSAIVERMSEKPDATSRRHPRARDRGRAAGRRHRWQACWASIPDVGGEPRTLLERRRSLQKRLSRLRGRRSSATRPRATTSTCRASAPCVFVSRAHRRGDRRALSVPGDAVLQRGRPLDGRRRARRARARDRPELAAWMRRLGRGELPARAEGAQPAAVLQGQGRAAARGGAERGGRRRLPLALVAPQVRRPRRRRRAGAEPAVPPAPAARGGGRRGRCPPEPAPLPPVESLTPESDFAPFMAPEVDPATCAARR